MIGVDYFTVKVPTFICHLFFALKVLFKISRICSTYQICKEGGFCREKLDHRAKRKLLMYVFACVGGECVLTIF